MYNILENYNFGPGIINLSMVLYADVQSCVLNNGFTSEWFTLSRGLRQGCPASALIFDLVGNPGYKD